MWRFSWPKIVKPINDEDIVEGLNRNGMGRTNASKFGIRRKDFEIIKHEGTNKRFQKEENEIEDKPNLSWSK